MKVLELMKSCKLFDVQAVGGDNVWLALKEMLSLNAGDLGDSGEGVGQVCRTPLHAVPMIDPSLTCLLIYIELEKC